MVTEYVSDVSAWETWQQEYRYGVLLIHPPDPLRAEVSALRARYDPRSQSYCDAHISLTIPLPRPLEEADWVDLESAAGTLAPIALSYGPLKHYLPYPGVCLDIRPQAELDRLLEALESASAFRDASPRRYPFSAHMTIAEFITVEETERLMVELEELAPSGTFLCDAVSYAVPDDAMHFSERQRLRLGPGGPVAQDRGGLRR